MTLTEQDLAELTAWRRQLHQNPELSTEEEGTAAEVVRVLSNTDPDKILTGLGGYGVAVVYDGFSAGPTLMFRSELDALPIEEHSGVAHASRVPGKAHMCGHDGHTTILAALGRAFGRNRPKTGRVVLLFQPAEEIGSGARSVVADPRYAEVMPDFVFALHNWPGLPLGEARLKAGVVNCASRGVRLVLSGRTAHASMPETGVSPMAAVSRLMLDLTRLSGGTFADDDFAMVTITHARLGAPSFGIAPGEAKLWATLRTREDGRMTDLRAAVEDLVASTAHDHGLGHSITDHDVFAASVNAVKAVQHLKRALDDDGILHTEEELPMRASEDFGVFGHRSSSAMVFLGAGEHHPPLHAPDYDFPDALIPIGAGIFLRTAKNLLG